MRATTRRIAMWSGPRNISTALMRSFGNRQDCHVCDEPLYAFYLQRTGYEHPIASEVVERGEPDWRRVVDALLGDLPEGRTVFYQKHMAHHLLPEVSRDWLAQLTHCFLIREPREMLTSLLKILPEPGLLDTGLPQQLEIFESTLARTGEVPPVIDSKDVLDAPEALLRKLCERIDLPFVDGMLEWPPGSRETDGVWAPHWYGAVEKTRGFQPYRPKPDVLPERFLELHAECENIYERLYAHRLVAG